MSRLRFSRLPFLSFAAVLLNGTVCVSAFGAAAVPAAPSMKTSKSKASQVQQEAKRALPLVFEENAGQLPMGTAFAGRTNNYTVQVLPSELRFGLPGNGKTRVVTLSFEGSKDAQAVGLADAGFRTNFYLGNDPRNWHANVRNFNRVALRGLYPGIDAQFYANGNEIEHDFLVAPGTDPSQLALHLAGAKSVKISASGDVVLAAEEGALRLKKPFAYQTLADGSRKAVPAQFVLASGDELTFKLGDYDTTRELVIDPVITFATYVGGDNGALPAAVASDAQGNIYLTGTTTSTQGSFGASSTTLAPSTLSASPSPVKVAFIASVARANNSKSVNGSQIQWLTYYGASAGDTTPTAIALQPASYTPVGATGSSTGTLLYIAGQTSSTALAGTSNGGTTLATGSSTYGFIADFNESDGTAGSSTGYATYVDGGSATGLTAAQMNRTTTLQAITVDSTGAVTAVGSSDGTQYPTTAINLGPTLPTTFCKGNGASANQYAKGLLTTLPATLGAPTYSTYVCGKASGSTSSFYTLNGVNVPTPATAVTLPTYIITGSTNLDFPMSGAYDTPTPTNADLQPVFFTVSPSTATNAFAALLDPNSLNVNWSYWSGGNAVDQSNGLTVDNSTSSPQVFVFGSTSSSNFTTASQTSPASTVTVGYMGYNFVPQQTGFVIGFNPSTGAFGSTTFLESSGANPSTVTAAVPDGNGNLFIAGSMTGLKQSFPTYFSGGNRVDRASTNLLPMAQDTSADPNYRPGASNYTASYLVRMPESLASVDFLSYFGPPSYSGASAAVGVAIDAQDSATLPGTGTGTSPLAYVLINETTAAGAPSYTSSDAESQLAQAGATNAAYLAQVAYAAPGAAATFSYDPSQATYTPNPVSYSASGQSSVTITWPVQVAAAGTSQLVFNLPQSQYLATYASSMLTVMSGSTDVSADCSLGTANASANPASNYTVTPAISGPGFTCVIPLVAGGTTVTFKLSSVPVTPAIPLGSTFQVVPTAFDATGQSQQLPVTITAAGVPTLSLSDSVTVTNTAVNPNTTATTTSNASPITVGAAKSATDSGTPNDQVTFTYTLASGNDSNGHAYDSPQTTLTAGLPANFTVTGYTCTITGGGTCSTPSANYDLPSFDLPASATLTYNVTGVFLATSFPANSSALTATMTTPSAAFGSPVVSGPTSTSGTAYSFAIRGSVTVTVALAKSAQAAGSGYQLGEAGVSFTLTLTNTGANQADSVSASVTLPKGFVTTTVPTGCTGTGPVSCTTGTLAGQGGSASFQITGSFSDTGLSSDAVAPPPTTSSTVSPAIYAGYSASAPVTSYVPASSVTVSSNQNTTPPSTASTSCSIASLPTPAAVACGTVSRTNNSTLVITATTTLSGSTVNELNSADTNDRVTFKATVSNTPNTAAMSVVRGLLLQVPIPSAATVNDISNISFTATSGAGAVSTPNTITCDAYVAGATFLNCYERDLTTSGAPTVATTTPTAITYTVQFDARYKETTVPLTTASGNVQFSSTAGSFYAAASGYFAAPVSQTGSIPGPFTVQRLTSLSSSVAAGSVGAAPAAYSDKLHITLDSHTTGDVPGAFDSVLFSSTAYNTGVNDAAGVAVSIAIPAFMRIAVPSGCVLGTITGPSTGLVATGASASALVCTPPSSTTPAGTAAGQLAAATASCPAAAAPAAGAFSTSSFDGKCFSVSFYGKFVDSPSATGTIVQAAATGNAVYAANTVAENDVDTTKNLPAASTVPAVTTIQRAAHLRLAHAIAVPTDTTGTALTLDAGGTPQVAQAALHMDPLTRLATGGSVYNCLRYEVAVNNEGPNYVLSPTLNYGETPTTFVPTRVSIGSAPNDTSAVNCSMNSVPSVTALSPLGAGASQSAYIDGYYNTGSLVNVNSGTATFTNGAFGAAGFQDSDTVGTAAVDYASTRTVTLVNTPYTDANNQKFGITAYGTTPLATLIFTSVTNPGITSAFSATTATCTAPAYDSTHPAPPANVNICFPYARSPIPVDAGLVRNIYQAGKTPQYYQLPSTAVVPTSSANPTSICFTMNGAAFADVFVKPERVLLWLMANASAGTTYGSIPLLASTQLPSPLGYQTGDVTAAVVPYQPSATTPSYRVTPASITFPQPPQAQPGQVCGLVNGFVNTAKADSTATPSAETFGVLEPVNFPPVVVAGSLQTTSLSGKGSTTTLTDIYLQRAAAGSTTKLTYDYDDSDPCYVADATLRASGSAGTPRQTCDDNPYLYALTFNGGNTSTNYPAQPVSALPSEQGSGAPANSYVLNADLALNGSANLFVAVLDQATGADSYNTNITGTNPFAHQGNFLAGNSNSSAQVFCDPGNSAVGGYVYTGTPCNGGVGGGTLGSQRYIRGGQKDLAVAANYNTTQDLSGNYYVLGNVGAQSVNGQGSSTGISIGLIPLPYPGSSPTSTNPLPLPAATVAASTISAGQTTGFYWPWLSTVTGSAGAAVAGDQYSLSCNVYDAATQQTIISMPTGMTCSITTTTPDLATSDPTVYTFSGGSVAPRGSTAPTIYISTQNGVLYGKSTTDWKRGAEGIALAMLLPAFFFRRRLGRGATLAIMFLMLAATPLLSGCGSGASAVSSNPTTPSGTYYFRVTATPTPNPGAHGELPIRSAPFTVTIQ